MLLFVHHATICAPLNTNLFKHQPTHLLQQMWLIQKDFTPMLLLHARITVLTVAN